MSLASQIESVQPDVFYKLLSEPFFNQVAIFMLREKRLDTQVNKALAGLAARNGGAGATIEILFPTLRTALPDTPGPVCTLEQAFIVKTQETINLGANGTGLTNEQIAVNLAQCFQLFFLGNAVQGFYASPQWYQYEDAGPGSPFLMTKVILHATFSLSALPRQASPAYSDVLVSGTDTVTLTDRQPGGGSVIYYTKDASFPGPGNPAATKYTAAFTVPSGTIVRSAAYAQITEPGGAKVPAGNGSNITDMISS